MKSRRRSFKPCHMLAIRLSRLPSPQLRPSYANVGWMRTQTTQARAACFRFVAEQCVTIVIALPLDADEQPVTKSETSIAALLAAGSAIVGFTRATATPKRREY